MHRDQNTGIMGRTFYVDADPAIGNDGNNGRHPESAWQTINKVNAQLAASIMQPDDAVLFKRGQDFRGWLQVLASGRSFRPITFGAYGPRSAGTKPEDWQDQADWPRIGYDARIDKGAVWTQHMDTAGMPTGVFKIHKDAVPGLGTPDQMSYANYRDPAKRETTLLRESVGQGLDGVIKNHGRVLFLDPFIYVHILDRDKIPTANPSRFHVYLNTGTRVDGAFARYPVNVEGQHDLVFDSLQFICGHRGVRLNASSSCLVRNCYVTGHGAVGLHADGGTVDAVFQNNEVTESSNGIRFQGQATGVAQDNYVHDIDPDRTRWDAFGPDREGITIRNTSDVEVVGNRLEGIGGFGAILIHRDAGMPPPTGLRIHRNTIRTPFVRGFSVGVLGSGETDIVFHHNLIIGARSTIENTTTTGVEIVHYPPSSTQPVKIYNNTFIRSPRNATFDTGNIRFQNNISINDGTVTARHVFEAPPAVPIVNHTRDHNCYWLVDAKNKLHWDGSNLASFEQYTDLAHPQGQELSSVSLDPDLDGEHRLQGTSPAACRTGGFDLWSMQGGALDLDGKWVPNNSGETSMGAFQWGPPTPSFA